jgi:CRP-like cAMP-binding protein
MANVLARESGSSRERPGNAVFAANRLFLALCGCEPGLRRGAAMVKLAAGEIFDDGHYAYFIEKGVASIRCNALMERTAEVGIAGPHAFIGLQTALLPGSSWTVCVAQTDCSAVRIRAQALAEAWRNSSAANRLLGAFLSARLTEAMLIATCTACHTIEQRLARTLLRLAECVEWQPLSLTHQHLADALAVRRASVTTALHVLEGEHAVHSRRGVLGVWEREKLERHACPCHRMIRGAYEAAHRRIGEGRREHGSVFSSA